MGRARVMWHRIGDIAEKGFFGVGLRVMGKKLNRRVSEYVGGILFKGRFSQFSVFIQVAHGDFEVVAHTAEKNVFTELNRSFESLSTVGPFSVAERCVTVLRKVLGHGS